MQACINFSLPEKSFKPEPLEETVFHPDGQVDEHDAGQRPLPGGAQPVKEGRPRRLVVLGDLVVPTRKAIGLGTFCLAHAE